MMKMKFSLLIRVDNIAKTLKIHKKLFNKQALGWHWIIFLKITS